ncbi:DUF4394 domain-containing protein [Nonomuraea gerenzanensis]|uniref:DUF4394 domain-containing protein n=1 Tax=Nonomuraea gerenzanensis TaxID=93944 RepID=A0A1M4E9T1_9ACTN|nr:DUF4394 domain-containing protein [Nonomuraea gerenzanensis]UBU17727.1 DUF4394 domain-containing protein [Nonomuraea gerenzanensis]SBO95504.1 hypothetical protein BN4615_P5020 [Nonomuraea gerenzanensis]
MRKQLALAVTVLGAGAVLAASPAQAHSRDDGPRVTGLTTMGELVTFDAGNPKSVNRVGKISGLKGDMKVVGIDYRVQNGKLYAVGDKGGVYTVDGKAKATKVSQLTVALNGQAFGVDFNPAANRLRVISDSGQNLRHNLDDQNGAPAAGQTATDGPLTSPPVPPATAGATALGVTGAGYTNNDLDATTATTLFDVDTTADQVSAQSPANAGNLAPTGKLGVDAAADAGFDVHSQLKKGVTVANTGYATLRVDGAYRFYTVNVLTGAATAVGTFPPGRQVSDIAVQLG